MKLITVFILGLLLTSAVFAQSGTTDTVVVSAKISKIEMLQKDWNASDGHAGEKIYHIYWMEFTLSTDTLEISPADLNMKMPQHLVFKSPCSGLLSELELYRSFTVNDKVEIKLRLADLTAFIHNETRNMALLSIRKIK